MSSRIHPTSGEPFCPSCHAGESTSCTEEHEAYAADYATDLNEKSQRSELEALAADLAEQLVEKTTLVQELRKRVKELEDENARILDAKNNYNL